MFRISLLVIAMILISHVSDGLGWFMAYKGYVIALLLSLLIKPWLTNQLD
jgi:hypothetical protein